MACSNDDPGVTLTYLKTRSNLVTWAFLLEKSENSGFSEIITTSDMKGLRTKHLIEYMKICEY